MNGVYLFVLEGEICVDGETLGRRDGMGIWETEGFGIGADAASVLVIEIPM